jgi:hypothetical protein
VNTLTELIEHAKKSDAAEAKHIAEFIEKQVDDDVSASSLEASIFALSEWADMFRRKVIERQKRRI